MFSNTEVEYVESLVNVYKSKGYKYYLAHTVTERYNSVDVEIYFSKEEIKASTEDIFIVKNGLKITLDSGSRNYENTIYSPRILLADSNFNGTVNVNVEEFIFTNASLNYELTQSVVNPDIMISQPVSPEFNLFSYSLLFLVVSIFIYMFVKSILRIKN